MTQSMIEKVARAMAAADPDQSGQINDTEMGEYFWEKYRAGYLVMAKAAIGAMVEPTEGMILANSDAAGPDDQQTIDDWKAMIQAALKE